ncbi:hypothetical protein PPNSA23_34720 [Phyllobacterium phragmitis]|uniref:Uncharacterized protein n=1 Tax=Phyllobacterium phragmitis TaxID=2670329 RepID=A0ABQ0H3P8_9HYPH
MDHAASSGSIFASGKRRVLRPFVSSSQEAQEPEDSGAPAALSLRVRSHGIGEAPTPAAVAMLPVRPFRGKHIIEAF